MPSWLVTGAAGFIGSHLVEALLARGDQVTGLDDFSTGLRGNLPAETEVFRFIDGDICDPEQVATAMAGVDYVLHQAAVPSVPRSVKDPWRSNRVNVEGSLNVFLAARDAGVRRVVYASSSSVYGDSDIMPVVETLPRKPISPYAVSKATMEAYAEVFQELYGIELVALRYFNVFGPRQRPDSAYAAVIPIFLSRMLQGERPPVNGDGGQARDFSFIENVVQANLKAAEHPAPLAGAFNIACGAQTSLLQLVDAMNAALGTALAPVHQAARAGDIRSSLADIEKARTAFGYAPEIDVEEGLRRTIAWFQRQHLQQDSGYT